MERVKFVSDSTEPANFRGSYTAGSRDTVDIEIAMYQSARIVITDTITIAPRTIVTTAMQPLSLKQTVSEQEGGLKN